MKRGIRALKFRACAGFLFSMALVARALFMDVVNSSKTQRRVLYLKTQFVPRSKHFSSRL